jgi:hypothetical protein
MEKSTGIYEQQRVKVIVLLYLVPDGDFHAAQIFIESSVVDNIVKI